MQEIKCPKCGEVFQVDESGYAAIGRQVRDKEFEKELSERKAQYLSESLRQQRAHGSWQRQTPVPGRKSFCPNRKRRCPKRTLRSAF